MQPTLILWGDKDQIFPIELAHRLKRFASNSYITTSTTYIIKIKTNALINTMEFTLNGAGIWVRMLN